MQDDSNSIEPNSSNATYVDDMDPPTPLTVNDPKARIPTPEELEVKFAINATVDKVAVEPMERFEGEFIGNQNGLNLFRFADGDSVNAFVEEMTELGRTTEAVGLIVKLTPQFT